MCTYMVSFSSVLVATNCFTCMHGPWGNDEWSVSGTRSVQQDIPSGEGGLGNGLYNKTTWTLVAAPHWDMSWQEITTISSQPQGHEKRGPSIPLGPSLH